MKEYQVEGLMELRRNYEEKLNKLPGYSDLLAEFRRASLDKVREAVRDAGLDERELKPYEPDNEPCGFCTFCVTPCTSCVTHRHEDWLP